MTVTTFYRLCVWMPVVIPAVLIVLIRTLGLGDLGVAVEMVAYSLLYGGIPYIALALWATWWIGGQPEPEIRRMMFRAPLLMLAVFVPLALFVGVVVGALVPFAAVAALGGVVILLLGYAYVGLTEWLRTELGTRVRPLEENS